MADPGPIASMFWMDEELESEIYLDGKKNKWKYGICGAESFLTHQNQTMQES